VNEHVLEALQAESDRAADFLESLTAGDLGSPTRCPPLSVLEVAAHAFRGSRRIVEMIEAGPVEAEAEKSAITYFRYDADAEASAIVQRAQEVARTFEPAAWRPGWDEALRQAEPHLKVDPVFGTVFGLMHLSEYLKTRVVEVVIHAMDMRHALNLSPDPTGPGLTACCDVLRGLLGADVRPLGMDDVRFAETATGRATLDDAEREMLGPLADLFPVLA